MLCKKLLVGVPSRQDVQGVNLKLKVERSNFYLSLNLRLSFDIARDVHGTL